MEILNPPMGKRVPGSMILEVLVKHFADHPPSDDWVVKAMTERTYANRIPGRPKGSKDRSPDTRPKWGPGSFPDSTKIRPAPRVVREAVLYRKVVTAIKIKDGGLVADLQGMIEDEGFNWHKIEQDAYKELGLNPDGTQHGGTEERDDDSNRNSDSEDGGGDQALPEERQEV